LIMGMKLETVLRYPPTLLGERGKIESHPLPCEMGTPRQAGDRS
jgi:hypothetical protein